MAAQWDLAGIPARSWAAFLAGIPARSWAAFRGVAATTVRLDDASMAAAASNEPAAQALIRQCTAAGHATAVAPPHC